MFSILFKKGEIRLTVSSVTRKSLCLIFRLSEALGWTFLSVCVGTVGQMLTYKTKSCDLLLPFSRYYDIRFERITRDERTSTFSFSYVIGVQRPSCSFLQELSTMLPIIRKCLIIREE